MDYTFVDTPDILSSIIPKLCDLPTSPPSLYIDLEGENLSRKGAITIIQIYVLPLRHTYLIDIHVLKDAAFTTASATPVSTPTLKDILESPDIPKCIFDVRSDSDALYNLFGVSIQGVQDLQLMEFATRSRRRFLNGLNRCITNDAGLDSRAVAEFQRKKTEGAGLFVPERGGSYAILNERPMRPEILDYCIQDVKYLPNLWMRYEKKMSTHWWGRVSSATLDRVQLARDPGFDPGIGRAMAVGPAW